MRNEGHAVEQQPAGAPPGEPRAGPRLDPRIAALVIVPVLALVAFTASVLWHLRDSAIEGQQRELTLLSLALADEIDRSLQGAQEGIQAMQVELQQGHLPATGPEAARALQIRADLMPLIDAFWLIDAKGNPLATSGPRQEPPMGIFRPSLERLRGGAMAISSPFEGDSAQGESLALALRMPRVGALEGGWIVAGLPARSLLGAFSAAAPTADAQMGVFRQDGARLAGTIPVDLRASPAAPPGRASQVSGELIAIRDLPRFGVRIVLTRSVDAVLRAWRQTAALTAGAIALLAAVVAGAFTVVRRAGRHRDEARLALQTQLARAGKLEALGTLAGGVAHDFNNVLAAIMGYGEMAQDAATQGSAQRRQIDHLLKAARRGQTLIERILAFSRGGARSSTVFELEPIVDEVLALLGASLRPGLVLERALDAAAARVRGDPVQAFEAVMNLCTNAVQAMPSGGRLRVATRVVRVAQARVLSHSRLAAGSWVELSVRDEGLGIAPDVMDHLFEPFFTTRASQSGTGLGLAVVHGVMQEVGGAIDVQSLPGEGASFSLFFPQSFDPLHGDRRVRQSVPRGDGQPLLVLDDERSLVAMTCEMLRGLGYEPTGYTDPAQALQALRQTPCAFAGLVTDEVMPGLTGTELTRRLRESLPQLPVLLVTGYGGALLASRATEAGVSRILNKPVQRAELAFALAEMIR